MRWLLTVCLSLVLLTTPSALAREQSDAPDIEILGFSSDGRYFAYEQYGYDLAAGALDAAIFVVDRETNKQAQGFPFGFIATETDSDGAPARIGGHDIDLTTLQREDETPDIPKIRKLVREKAATKLAGFGISAQGRRIAGVPLTQRSPVDDKGVPLKFVIWPTIPSAIPDQQLVYSITAKVKDTIKDCVNAAPPARELPLTFAITAERTFPETRIAAKKEFVYPLPIAKEDCPAGIWISDIIAPPDAQAQKPVLMVVFLSQAWSSAVDSAQYRKRIETFDFDIVVASFPQSLSPGNEQREYWSTAAADQPNSQNIIGIRHRRAVRTFHDQLGADAGCVFSRQLAFERGGDQHVTRQFEQFGVGDLLRATVAF